MTVGALAVVIGHGGPKTSDGPNAIALAWYESVLTWSLSPRIVRSDLGAGQRMDWPAGEAHSHPEWVRRCMFTPMAGCRADMA